MNKIITFLTVKFLPDLILITVVGATASIGVYSASKISSPENGILNKGVKEVVFAKSLDTNTQADTNTEIKDPSVKNQENLCLVQISGKQYNVFNLRASHSGGDIFTCNTDMTSSYTSQHGTDLSRMQTYLYTAPTNVTFTKPNGLSNSVAPNKVSTKSYTLTSLATHNNGTSCFIAYSGKVYDVTGNASWTACSHHGIIGGKDITGLFPHPTSYLASIPVVGSLVGSAAGTNTSTSFNDSDDDRDEDDDDEDERDEREEEDEKDQEQEEEIEIED